MNCRRCGTGEGKYRFRLCHDCYFDPAIIREYRRRRLVGEIEECGCPVGFFHTCGQEDALDLSMARVLDNIWGPGG